MSILNSKITGYAKSIKALADTPKMTAAELKSWFDGRTDEEVKTAINNLVDELTGQGAAGQLGAEEITGLVGKTVQALLVELWAQLKDRDAAVRQEALGEITRVENKAETAIQELDNAAAKKENTYTKEETNKAISKAVGVLDAEFTKEMEALDTATAKKIDTYTKNEVDGEIDTKIERRVVAIGAGDMRIAEYGGSAVGIVKDSDKLGGQPPAHYATAKAAADAAAAAQNAQNTADTAQATADTAQATADTAQATANAALPKTGTAANSNKLGGQPASYFATQEYAQAIHAWADQVDNTANTALNAANGKTTKLEVYPVGAIYLSTASTSPASLFGGTWSQLKDRFLLAAGSTYTAGKTDGAATHTLTVNEIASHRHLEKMSTSTTDGANVLGVVNGLKLVNDTAAGSGYGNIGYTDYTGGGAAHNNMPPYLVVYMWKRTA